jgi:hypothetical protein
MPNVNRQISPFVGGGNPDTFTEPVSTTPGAYQPYAGGDLGTIYDYNDKTYQKVRLDSGATAATATGVVAANQLAFWKDRSQYLVTNDSTQALFAGAANSFRNNVAGVFRSAVAAGYQCFVLTKGRQINLKEAGSATAGMILEANSGTAADSLGIAVGTGPGYIGLGVVTTATSGTTCVADFDIPGIP